ncbi:TM0106 family RecB-like putative nuclease [Zhihengliuella sp.]|uniref:TM0106 family RecB-like putative nuclease n=1 Tax=Zhihengliuella sp. TaxID=1954483 RepID=UPI00281267E1|nr:TM0106 family RecB-like putative nuclease [Zhihengliuella sp.]
MYLLQPGGDLVYSASDLVLASQCEYQALVKLDDRLGRRPAPVNAPDEMLERAARLGDAHERRVLDGLIARFGRWDPATGGGVLELPAAGETSPDVLEQRRRATEDALGSGADVVFQATFWNDGFVGFADFLVREPDGRYAVWDTKLARHAKPTALLQIAAYAEQLELLGLQPSDDAVLVLGTDRQSRHPVQELIPVLRDRRRRFLDLVGAHRAQPDPVSWEQPGLLVCGRCDYCAAAAREGDDLLLVARMTLSTRARLRAIGVRTVRELAGLTDGAARAAGLRVSTGALSRLRDQARMQCGLEPGDGGAPGDESLRFRVLEHHRLEALPAPCAGDVFFDFEGDPLWQDPADGSWGLEYLFGVVEHDAGSPVFRPFWAHTRAEERAAFLAFVDYIEERRRRWPELRIYHYAPYEKTALRHLSTRHGVAEEVVDEWLRTELFVDLFETVRESLRISASSYSIKKLEPFYMGDEHRSGDVTDAGASVVAYAAYCASRDAGDEAEAAAVLASIGDYNRYDCLSTLRLRDWLLDLGRRHPARTLALADPSGPGDTAGAGPSARAADPPAAPADEEPSPEEARLAEYLAGLPDAAAQTPQQRAVALTAAATAYHRRERKQFWWAHFDRLEGSLDDWRDTRDVIVVEHGEVETDWEKPPRKRTFQRRLRLTGRPGEGTVLGAGSNWFALYDAPVPEQLRPEPSPAPAAHQAGRRAEMRRAGHFGLTVDAMQPDADGRIALVGTERARTGAEGYTDLPLALTPGRPIDTTSIEQALAEVAHDVGAALPSLPATAGMDLLTRAEPRLRDGLALPPVQPTATGHDYTAAVTEAVRRLDGSYLAVQGPPGTGKTYVGARVIERLVEEGWKVGVVAQSHVTVDGLLARAVEAGVPADRVAKRPKPGAAADAPPWTRITDDALEDLLAEPGGCLIGGTAWTMTGRRVPRRALDLLVVDEAGQFSLANTLAVGEAARNLLLLGDPQQLPQVSQGQHPAPVDESALGWLSAGRATLPPELGYFLADTWRMHPELCRPVSRLSYAGALESAPAASRRRLEGFPAGIETVLVDHAGCTTSSPEEAEATVEQVRRHLGALWHDPDRRDARRTAGRDTEPRPLDEEQILVVAAYNAQVQLLREALDAAGLHRVRVGTVDRFQGQEAPVVILSLAVSSPEEAPRGMDFLLNRNRLNVAVSRGMWRAVIIRSPRLTDYLPASPEAMAELGAFLRLDERD